MKSTQTLRFLRKEILGEERRISADGKRISRGTARLQVEKKELKRTKTIKPDLSLSWSLRTGTNLLESRILKSAGQLLIMAWILLIHPHFSKETDE